MLNLLEFVTSAAPEPFQTVPELGEIVGKTMPGMLRPQLQVLGIGHGAGTGAPGSCAARGGHGRVLAPVAHPRTATPPSIPKRPLLPTDSQDHFDAGVAALGFATSQFPSLRAALGCTRCLLSTFHAQLGGEAGPLLQSLLAGVLV